MRMGTGKYVMHQAKHVKMAWEDMINTMGYV